MMTPNPTGSLQERGGLTNEMHERFMQAALAEARRAREHEDAPIGAVAVLENRIIARAHNRKEIDRDPTAHAELLVIRKACRERGHWWLEEVDIYSTLEPCSMCAGALVLARVRRLVFGAADPKAGACGSVMNLIQHEQLNHRIEIVNGVLAGECGELLSSFFRDLRAARSRGTPLK